MAATKFIPERQNQPEALELLAAASQLYGYGKLALALQISLTIGLAVTAAIVTLFLPTFKIWATSIGVTVVWLDVIFIDRIQIHYRKRGALLQEQFDQRLFDIPWNELRAGKQLEPEEVHRAASKFIKENGDLKLRDWYPSSLDGVPLSTARIICQRSCLWWDTSQRRVYGYWLAGVVAASIIVLWAIALVKGISMSVFILSVYAPVAPAIIWAAREMRRQRDAADGLEKARNFVDGVWKRMTRSDVSESELLMLTRQIQDTLFDNRSKNPLIFNWIYRHLRSDREAAMVKAAERLVSEMPPSSTA